MHGRDGTKTASIYKFRASRMATFLLSMGKILISSKFRGRLEPGTSNGKRFKFLVTLLLIFSPRILKSG